MTRKFGRALAGVIGGFLSACGHTDTFPTGSVIQTGPVAPTSMQLTFNPGDDYFASWTPDGSGIVYAYVNEDATKVKPGSRCIALVSIMSGTRRFTLCDTRSTEADSASMFSAGAMRSDGELLFVQGVGIPWFTPFPKTFSIWLVDTAAPLHTRHELARLPRPMGDSVIENLTDASWIDANTFIAIGNRMLYPCQNLLCTARDTLTRPVYLVRGTMNGNALTLAEIRGTDFAARWARLPNGDIVFVRGTLVDPPHLVLESTVMRAPADGGPPVLFATSPGGAIRGLTCQAHTCLMLSSILYRMNPDNAALTPVVLGVGENFATWDSPILSPDGSVVVYRQSRNLFRAALPVP